MAAVGACTAGAPPGFSEGDQWTIPLVGPLEDGLLLVPALFNDKGPFVFAIDPDAHVTIIDEEVLATTKALTGEGPRMLDETDKQQTRIYAEMLSLQVGTLTVKGPKYVQVIGKGTFDADGRRIHGVIGRDVIADSLVFGFNRDAGVVTLSTQKAFKVPAGATSVTYTKLLSSIINSEVIPLPRRLVHAEIGGMKYPLHVDFGASYSQLRMRAWPRAKLASSETQLGVVDEAGMIRPVKQKGVADTVKVRDLATRNVTFVPYADKRWPDTDIEGTLGLGFFKPYSVIMNWDSDTFYLLPRKNTSEGVVVRLGRWQSKTLSGCANTGCIKATLIDPLAGKPAEEMPAKHPGLVASFARDPSALKLDLEVLVAVTPAAGKPQLKWFIVNLPAGADRAITHVSADYIGATLTVMDASPFPRSCTAAGGCVDQLPAPTAITPDAPQFVADLKKISGDDEPSLDADMKATIANNTSLRLTSDVKICVDQTGHVRTIEVTKPSGYPKYDLLVVDLVKKWVYEPYVLAGKPSPACTNASFSVAVDSFKP